MAGAGAIWEDWPTRSSYRIRIAPRAARRLGALSPERQHRVQAMIEDVADLAALLPESGRRFRDAAPLLDLRLGKLSVRYRIDEEARTISIEHLVGADPADLDVG